ncbi:MAG: DNA-formamidopyrimidine glycosylase [Patescibacteria group bacterium]
MPEMPEVETIASDLSEKIRSQEIISLELLSPKSVKNTPLFFKKNLLGASFKKISRRGKLLIFALSKNENFLLIHLKMTGQLIYINKKIQLAGGHSLNNKSNQKNGSFSSSVGGALPNKHTRVVINFKNGGRLFFNDLRKFGYLKIVTLVELNKILENNYGPEPLTSEFSVKYLEKLFARRNIKIKVLLLDQKLVAGLGNIYVDEALFASEIRPERLASSLHLTEIKKLFLEINVLIKKAIKYRGTTFSDYVDSKGQKGNFSKFLKVYGRKNENCVKCGRPIIKIKLAGRGTHYCSHCQK